MGVLDPEATAAPGQRKGGSMATQDGRDSREARRGITRLPGSQVSLEEPWVDGSAPMDTCQAPARTLCQSREGLHAPA